MNTLKKHGFFEKNKLGQAIRLASSGLAVTLATLPATQYAISADVATLEEVVVTGTRLSNKRLIEAKRETMQISDSVASDDIASLPDFNLAESLQRVPGVATDLDNGEDRFVIVRGMNSQYNFTTVDGLILPSSDTATRSVLFDIVPSSVVKRVDIVKSFSPDMDGQAIGGRINLVSRSAFDHEGAQLALSGAQGYWEEGELGPEDVDPSMRFNGAYSNTFGADDQFGVVFAANYLNRQNYTVAPTHSGSKGFHEVGDGWVPDVFNSYLYYNERERIGMLGKLEYMSNQRDLYAYLTAFSFTREDNERLDEHRVRTRASEDNTSNVTTSGGRVESNIEPAVSVRDALFDDSTNGVQTGSEFSFDDKRKIEAKMGYAKAELEQDVFRSLFYGSRTSELAFDYRANNDDVFVAHFDNPGAFTDASLVDKHYETKVEDISNEEEVFEAKVDYSFNLEEGALGFGYKAGVKTRQAERVRDVDVLQYRPDSSDREEFPLTMALDSESGSFDSVVHGGLPVFFVDLDAARRFQIDNPDIVKLMEETSVTQSTQGDYAIEEDVRAAYLMGVWSGERFRVSFGVRYEDTDIAANGFQRNLDGSFSPIDVSSGYDNILPRADFIYDLTDSWRLRGAYSKSVSRGDYDQLTPNTSVSEPSMGKITLSSGNPGLEPRVSDNLDLSLEHYFESFDGLFSVGLFHKEIKDEIFVRSNVEQGVEFDGEIVELTTRISENADSAELTGIEFGLIISTFDFLPEPFNDFGIAANYAYIDSDASFSYAIEEGDPEPVGSSCRGLNCTRDLPGLFKQPDQMANIAITYNNGPFDAKLAYNYQGKRLKDIRVENDATFDRFYRDQGRLDAQVRYWIRDNLRISLEAKNITGSYAQEVVGDDLELHHTYRDVGASYWLGVSYKY